MSNSLWAHGLWPVHGILQARIMEGVAFSSSRGSSPPRDGNQVSYVSCIAGNSWPSEPREDPTNPGGSQLKTEIEIATYLLSHPLTLWFHAGHAGVGAGEGRFPIGMRSSAWPSSQYHTFRGIVFDFFFHFHFYIQGRWLNGFENVLAFGSNLPEQSDMIALLTTKLQFSAGFPERLSI